MPSFKTQPKYTITMAIIIWITSDIPSLGPIIISVTRAIVVNISTYVNLFILDVILLIIRRVVDPKLMDHHTGCVMGLLAGP
ncbi:putative PurR-regulated permease PerM [Lysinibacillus sp. RC79]